MKFACALTCFAGLFQALNAMPSMPPKARQTSCNSPRLRKSWDAASPAEKKAYLDAAVCLTKQPSQLGLAGASRHEDFTWVHQRLANQIHGVAAFLPWHRYFVQLYENALRTECGYIGTALYWDWVADAPAPMQASVWDPVTGFGGNGSSPDGTPFSFCVRDGPFANLQLQFVSNDTLPHCLNRQFMRGAPMDGEQEMLGFNYEQRIIDRVMVEPDFLEFHARLEGGPHGSVHIGIANIWGDMGPTTSPNDPIFYLVHAQVDRLWWIWQQESASRLLDYSGNVWPEDMTGISATLDDTILMEGLAADKKVWELMNTQSNGLCYKY